jgi:hypothetical protein
VLACVGRTREATEAAKEYFRAHGESSVPALMDALASRRTAAFARGVLVDLDVPVTPAATKKAKKK